MSDKRNSINAAHQLLSQLKEAFIAELPERCGELERYVLALQSTPEEADAVWSELYRKVHSLKGSGGTHGIPVISSICHQFEDCLMVLGPSVGPIDSRYVSACLSYIDLIRRSAEHERLGQTTDTGIFEQALERLRHVWMQNRRPGLLVESSPLMAMMYQNALQELPVQLTLVDDGLTALQRLMHEHFAFVITAKTVKGLNGIALTYALRASQSPNRKAKVILVSASNEKERFPEGLGPDVVVQKNTQLSENLTQAVRAALAG